MGFVTFFCHSTPGTNSVFLLNLWTQFKRALWYLEKKNNKQPILLCPFPFSLLKRHEMKNLGGNLWSRHCCHNTRLMLSSARVLLAWSLIALFPVTPNGFWKMSTQREELQLSNSWLQPHDCPGLYFFSWVASKPFILTAQMGRSGHSPSWRKASALEKTSFKCPENLKRKMGSY